MLLFDVWDEDDPNKPMEVRDVQLWVETDPHGTPGTDHGRERSELELG